LIARQMALVLVFSPVTLRRSLIRASGMFNVARIIITSFLCKNDMPILYACQVYSAIKNGEASLFLMHLQQAGGEEQLEKMLKYSEK